MTLIDKDELLKALKQRFNNLMQWDETAAIECYEIVDIVKEQPTIDPVKHAEWKEDGALYKCTNCGHAEEYYDFSYCPCCGARMDE